MLVLGKGYSYQTDREPPPLVHQHSKKAAVRHVSEKKYQSHTHILTISNGMNMSLPPPCFSVLKMYIQKLNYQVFPIKTSEAFQMWTKCVENKWE